MQTTVSQTPALARQPAQMRAGARRAVKAQAVASPPRLPPSAQRRYEELSAETARTLQLDNWIDGYYVSPKFLDQLAVHCAKNYMAKSLNKIKIPLILGIWGGKGQGKTFQVTLAMKGMNIEPIIMSAGELEAGNAGEPAKLVRQRYREASDIIKKGKMSALFINDLDAGAGRLGESTQYTVNNQMVNATLMNIADNPTNVQLPGVYKEEDIPRVPIICTGNDFSTLYAPLIRDGRMAKYYWNPTRADRIGVCMGIFKEDGLSQHEVESLVDAFPGQSIDFFGALRARIYDDAVRGWAVQTGFENLGKNLVNARGGPPTLPKPSMTRDLLMEYGNALVQEQDNVKRVQLAEQYLAGAALAGTDGSSIPEAYIGGSVPVPKAESKKLWNPRGNADARRRTQAPESASAPPPPPPPAAQYSAPAQTPAAPAAQSSGGPYIAPRRNASPNYAARRSSSTARRSPARREPARVTPPSSTPASSSPAYSPSPSARIVPQRKTPDMYASRRGGGGRRR